MPEIKVNKEEFLKLPSEERDWTILETFSTQREICNGRFTLIENKIGWARTIIIALIFFGVGAGILKIDIIWRFISGFLGI